MVTDVESTESAALNYADDDRGFFEVEPPEDEICSNCEELLDDHCEDCEQCECECDDLLDDEDDYEDEDED